MDEAVLAPLRRRIDAVDAAMVALLAERFAIVREVVVRKSAASIAARLDDRVEAVVANVRVRAEAAGCPPDLAETVWRSMIDWVIGYEEKALLDAAAAESHPKSQD